MSWIFYFFIYSNFQETNSLRVVFFWVTFFLFSRHRSCLCSAWGGRRWRCLKMPNWPSHWRVRHLEAWRGKCCSSALLHQTTSARPQAVSSPRCATSPMWSMAARKRAYCWRIPEGARALLWNCWIRLVGEDLGPWAAVGFTGLFCRTAGSGNWGGFGYVDSCWVYRSDDTELLDQVLGRIWVHRLLLGLLVCACYRSDDAELLDQVLGRIWVHRLLALQVSAIQVWWWCRQLLFGGNLKFLTSSKSWTVLI